MENKINKTFSKNLKVLRRKKGLTQQKVIEQIGEENLSLRTYKTYESGKNVRTPSIENVVTLAHFYNVSLDYLIFGEDLTINKSREK